MKTLTILSTVTFLFFTIFNLSAQESKKEILKSEIKNEKVEIKTVRKELQKLEGSEVSDLSVAAFAADFGKIPNVRWNRGVYMDEATYTLDGKEMKAYYDSDSKLVGTIALKTYSDLPLKAQNEIKKKYKEYTVSKVLYFDDNGGNDSDMFIFDTRFDDIECFFVELTRAGESLILQVGTEGEVSFFKKY